MLKARLQSIISDPATSSALIWRLLTEYGAARWRSYSVAFALMGIGAGATALTAYLAGDVINKAYVNRDFSAHRSGPPHSTENSVRPSSPPSM
jgi:hypothetical protein